MKKPLISLAFACGAMAFLSQDARVSAQQNRPCDVVLVDVNQIFKNYAGFTEMQADLKASLTVAQNDVKGRTEQRKQSILHLKQLRKGSAN